MLTAIVGLLVFLGQRDSGGRPSTEATITVQTARLPAGQRTEFASHRVILRVTGPPELLEKVDRVTYLLPPSFNAEAFSSSSADDGFAVRLNAAGSFLVQAKLHLRDGKTREATKQVDLSAA
jgi:hypothetical protein